MDEHALLPGRQQKSERQILLFQTLESFPGSAGRRRTSCTAHLCLLLDLTFLVRYPKRAYLCSRVFEARFRSSLYRLQHRGFSADLSRSWEKLASRQRPRFQRVAFDNTILLRHFPEKIITKKDIKEVINFDPFYTRKQFVFHLANQEFGNRTFGCVPLPKSFGEFDFLRLT